MIHHRDFEFVLQLVGMSCWHYADGCVEVAPGELLLIPAGVAHREDHNTGKPGSCNLNVYVMHDALAFHANVYPRPDGWTFLACWADYLSNCYSRQMGRTITQTINAERLALAQELLRSSDLNISEIAMTCGYEDPGYFGRLFKNLTGITPSAYRHSLSDCLHSSFAPFSISG